MTQRLLIGLLMLAGIVCAQHSVDPKNLYHRIICVTPLTGSGTATDPVRPKYAPWPMPVPQVTTATLAAAIQPQGDIIAFSYVLSDDGKSAIVEFVARSRAAFSPILADSSIQTFEKGVVNNSAIEAAMQKYRKAFTLEHFGTVMP
jgi:hypothetical protein